MIKIICVGKLKEKYLVDACLEYSKRISKYSKIRSSSGMSGRESAETVLKAGGVEGVTIGGIGGYFTDPLRWCMYGIICGKE